MKILFNNMHPEAYLGHSQTSMMELLKIDIYFFMMPKEASVYNKRLSYSNRPGLYLDYWLYTEC